MVQRTVVIILSYLFIYSAHEAFILWHACYSAGYNWNFSWTFDLYNKFFLIPYCHNTWSDVVLLTSSSVLPLTADVPLTLHNVTTAINNVKWEKLCKCLCVPESKKDHIEQQTSEHQTRMLAEWWLLTDPAASWRRLICRLDLYFLDPSCAAAADFIRHNAEPVQGMLSTFVSLFMCIHVITVYVVTTCGNNLFFHCWI